MVVVAVRLLGMFACAYGGYRVAELLNQTYILKDPQQALSVTAGIILGFLIGYVLGGIFGRFAADLLGRVEAAFYKVSGADLFFGTLGAAAGLLLALLPSPALFRFGYTGYIVSIILFLVFGFLGMRLGVQKRPALAQLLKLGTGLGGVGTAPQSRILDTSVIIDGRVVDIAETRFMDGTMVVPRFVLNEIQSIADSSDTIKRNRGRRGLEVLNALQRMENVNVEITDQDFPEIQGVDGKLIALSKLTGMTLATNDFNLQRVAEVEGVKVLNVNQLASALKPVVLPGEELKIKIIREGKEPGQGVGFLEDGTMVVVENGKSRVGSEVKAVTTSVLQTPAGKMIFTDLKEESGRGG